MQEQRDYDVVIVGAGIIGLTLARALAGHALKIAVIDAKKPALFEPTTAFDQRVSAITHASRRIFTALNCWQAMSAYRVSPYQAMHVWDANGSGEIHFDSVSIGEDHLGYIVENGVMQRVLWDEVHHCSDIDIICPVELNEFHRENNHIYITLKDKSILKTSLLVGADGAHSWVRKQAGIETDEHDYAQQALVATVRMELPHQKTAWQRFLTTGALAFLPLPEPNTCSIVWSTSSAEAETLSMLDDVEFCKMLSHHFDQRLGKVIELGPRQKFPLRMQHAKQYVQPELALVGDALHTLHPLAGQGLNLGLLDAACLADVVLAAHAKQQPLGSFAVLRRYERWRKGHNTALITTVGLFKRVFTHSSSLVSFARNMGLTAVNRMMPLKKCIIHYATGQTGELPPLAERTSYDNH